MHSIKYRITGLMFLLITITVLVLVIMANHQMTDLFYGYLKNAKDAPNAALVGQLIAGGEAGVGVPETQFLSSVHEALIWVGAGILIVGLVASYLMAQGITIPLTMLSRVAKEIEKGNFGLKVQVDTKDEIEQLAAAFNRMSDRLEANNRLRQQLLADIAHELKTPLTIIQGNLEGMLDGVIEKTPEQLNSLLEETVHLNRLIKDLRDLSLAEAGQLTLDKQPADFNQLVSRSAAIIKPLADEKNLSFSLELQSVPEVKLDAGRINQVIYNLMTNAIRYTPKNGSVRVATDTVVQQGQTWVHLCVADTGIGIAADDMAHIFDHFYRADKSRNRQIGGTGLGLAIVKQLVEVHGGRVEVNSTINVGSEFSVFLPVN